MSDWSAVEVIAPVSEGLDARDLNLFGTDDGPRSRGAHGPHVTGGGAS